MANDPTGPLALAVLAALTTPAITYTEGGTNTVTVHQRVPDEFTNEQINAVIVVANINLGPTESKDATPFRASVTIQTSYRGRSLASLQSIMGQVFQRLQKVTLTVTGFTVGECTLLTSDVGGEADEANLVHVGRQTFEVMFF